MCVLSDDLAYVHIPKTGGISCRTYLHKHLPGAVDPKDESKDSPFPVAHVPVRDIEHWSGRPLDSFERIVATVRDPFDRELSLWVHWRDSYARGGRHIVERTAAMYSELTHWLLDAYSGWELYYEEYVKGEWENASAANTWLNGMGKYEYWLTVDGELPDNLVVVRFSDLAAGFTEAVEDFVVNPDEFPHANPSPKRKTAGYYTPMAMRVIQQPDAGKYRWAFNNGVYTRKEWAGWRNSSGLVFRHRSGQHA